MEVSMKLQKRVILLTILMLSFMVFILTGCNNTNSNSQNENAENSAFQELYDRSIAAKEFADKHLNEYLKPFNSDYEVMETAYGFVTAEEPYYVVCYKCSNGINDLFYGYKISVDDSGDCIILDEGSDTGSILFR